MDGSRWAGRSGSRRPAVVVLALIALIAAVAIASTGSTPGGSGGARRPSEWLLDVLVSLLLVAMALGTVLLVLLVLLRPAFLVSDDVARLARPRNRAATLLSLAIVFGFLAFAIWRLTQSDGARRGLGGILRTDGDAALAQRDRYEPQFQAIPVAVILGLLAIALAAWFAAWRARARSLPPPAPDLTAALAEVIDDTLDDLRAERDPRRAVIAAYARLERVLAAYGAPRQASEAPEEYLERVLVDLEVPRGAVSRLTALYSRAKFSQHGVVVSMKDEAIEALETVRDGLREARERAEAEQAHAHAIARGSPA
jgi:uncharacterized protein DUF4129